MEPMQMQHVGMYGQPTEVGIVGRVAYTDRSMAAFVGPPLNMGAPSMNAGATPARGFRGTPDNAKTKMCLRWSAGDCRFGDRCNFAHGEHELRQAPKRDINVMLPQTSRFPGPMTTGGMGVASPFVGVNNFPAPVYMINPGSAPMMGGAGSFPGAMMNPRALQMRAHSIETTATGTTALTGTTPSYNSSSSPVPTNVSSPTKHSPTMVNAKDKPADVSMDSWQARGCPVPGANGWCKYITPDGQDYYHNFQTNVTQWDAPPDFKIPLQNTPTPNK